MNRFCYRDQAFANHRTAPCLKKYKKKKTDHKLKQQSIYCNLNNLQGKSYLQLLHAEVFKRDLR